MKRLIWGFLAISVFAACGPGSNKTALPIYGNREPVTKTIDGKSVTDTVYQTIPPFKFINQYGDSITNKSLDGDIYVADFFFTSCPSICPVMQRNMLNVYQAFKTVNDFKIISFSIDPKYDSVRVLKKYADKLGVAGKTWYFLQGKKDDTYKLAGNFLMSAPTEDKNVPGGHTHDGYFVLIDKQKRIRGTYMGTDPEQVTRMIADIKILRAEPDQTPAK